VGWQRHKDKKKGITMDLGKIVRLIAVLVAVVAAFLDLPAEATIIATLGLAAGFFIEEEYSQRFLLGVLALALAYGSLEPVWIIGAYLTDILASVSALLNAAACTVIVMGLINRLKP
jgi:hypothetical protein